MKLEECAHMAEQEAGDRRDEAITSKDSLRHGLFRLQWRYLRGWLVIAVVVFVTKLAWKTYSEISEWLGPVAGTADSRVLTIALTTVILVILPWAIGGLLEFPLRYLRGQRGFRALRQVEKRLSREFRPDEARGY